MNKFYSLPKIILWILYILLAYFVEGLLKITDEIESGKIKPLINHEE